MTILDTVDVRSPRASPTPRSPSTSATPRTTTTRCPWSPASAEGAWVTDVEGRRYLDCLAAYSAVNFGHRHPELIAAAHAQLDAVTLISRAFHPDQLGPFCAALAELCGKDMVLPMNSGAEAVESGIKVARKWGTDVKGVPAGQANIVVARQQLPRPHDHDRQLLRRRRRARGFGPYTPGFRAVPFGDADALAAAIDENTVAVLLEPIQGEAGVIVPPDDYLPRVRAICTRAQRADDRRRDPVRARPHRTHVRLRPLGRGARRLPARQGARRRRRAGVGGGRRRATSSACCTPASTARPSAATRWRPRSAPPWWRCWRPANTKPAQQNSASGCTPGCRALIGHGVLAVRGLGLWAGVDIDPALGTGKQISLASWPSAACSPRTPTARRCASPRRW